MAFNIRFLILCFVLFILLGCDSDPQAEELSQRWAKHDWSQNKPELFADINNDGVKERALIGLGDKTIIVAVYKQNNVNLIDFIEVFTKKTSQQNAICGSNASLVVEKQSYSPIEDYGLDVVGFKSCESCEGLLLEGNKDCNPFHIYWDHTKEQLVWWRT